MYRKATQTTLCFLFREHNGQQQILLAMKKRGFGVGKWNGKRLLWKQKLTTQGPGGKQDKEDIDIVHTAQRECVEEVGVKPTDLQERFALAATVGWRGRNAETEYF
jgi:8-oxo-dGTP diphosphatase/8-oxo-dGTP diphosphatase/2-hydroxy-dATP diphosphatase